MSKFLDETGLGHLIEKIKTAFVSKADTIPVSTIDVDTTPTANSTNLITSGGVYSAGYVAGTGITNVIVLTQSQYDAITTKSSSTLYVIQ